MTAPTNRWQELACDAALVGLDDDLRAELDALAIDTGELVALERAAAEIAAAALDGTDLGLPMPRDVRARVLGRLGEPEPAPRADVVPRPSHARAEAPTRSWLPWTLAAAAVVLAAIGWSRGTPRAPDPTRAELPRDVAAADAGSVVASAPPDAGRPLDRAALLAMEGTARLAWSTTKDPAARGAAGDVVWHGGLQHGFMSFRGLAPNDPAKAQYQLWIFDAERDDAYPVDGGVFDVGEAGEVVVAIDPKLRVGKPKLFAVTIEKPGGVVVSKRERIVVTAAPRG